VIYCEIELKKFIPHAGNRFESFNCEDYKKLLFEFHQIIELIELHAPNQLFSIPVKITVSQEIIPFTLLNFLRSQDNILFDIQVENHPLLQEKLREIYQQSVKRWFAKQIQKQKQTPTIRLRDLVKSIPKPELLYLPEVSLQSPHEDIVQWLPEIPKSIIGPQEMIASDHLNEQVATFLETFANVSQPDESLKNVKDAFPPILNTLFFKMGHEGLYYLLNKLKVLDKEQLEHLSRSMFRIEQHQNIHELAHPNCQFYINIIAAWPVSLFHNWLNWYAFNTTELSFIESIQALQKFWTVAQDYYPSVPRLEINRPLDFSAMTLHMHELISQVDKKWKKTQLKFLFNLDWSQYTGISQLIKEGHQWVSFEMLDSGHPLHQAYRYLAKNLDDNKEQSFERIHGHIHGHLPHAEFIAWLCCLKPLLNDEQISQIIPWFENLSNQTRIFESLKSIPEGECFSSKTFFNMHQSSHFENLLALYHIWLSKNRQSGQFPWQPWVDFYQKLPAPVEFDISSLESLNAAELYFSCLLKCIAQDQDTREISTIFSNLNSDIQRKVIYIFLSYSHTHPKPSNQTILNFLTDANLSTQTEETLNLHFPENPFLYFQKATQWTLVMNTLKDMLKGLHYVLECFSNDAIKVFSLGLIQPSFKQCIQEKLVVELTKIQTHISSINSLIQAFEEETSELNFESLFQEFTHLDRLIHEFTEKTLHDHLSSILMGYNGTVISLFDPSLAEPTSTFRDLFTIMTKKFDELAKVGIASYFNKEILLILSQTKPEESILENVMNGNLIQKISVQIPQKLEPDAHGHLLEFLGKIQLNEHSIEQFFQRIKVIEYVNQEWPKIADTLLKKNIQPEDIWEICSKHQLIHGQAYASTHWRICFELIEKLIDIPNLTTALAKILKAKSKFPQKLNFNGEIDHPNWSFTLKQIAKDFKSEIAQNSAFELLLEYAIEHYLKTGQTFNFDQFSTIFEKIQIDARHQLIALTDIKDAHLLPHVTNVLSKIQHLLTQRNNENWIKLVEKILLSSNLHTHLPNIPTIFNILQKEIGFPWLEIIIEDESSSLEEILNLIQKISHLPLDWQKTYPLTPVEKIQRPVAITQPKALSYLQIIQSQLSNPRQIIPNLLKLWAKEIPVKKAITQAPPPQENPKSILAKKAWKMWQSPIRPSVANLNRWLDMSPDDAQLLQELNNFDRWPHPQPQPGIVSFNIENLQEFIKEIEFHTGNIDWNKTKKDYLLQRLQHILNFLNYSNFQSMSELLEQYQRIKDQLMTGIAHSIDLENQFIGIIISLYFKALKKQVYPTQILCLLLSLEYGNHNVIFEIDTGEGKSIINALLAVLKYNRKENNIVIVRTANDQLVFQDFYQKRHRTFFQLLECPCHILKEFDDLEQIQSGGIFYTSQLNFQIFNALSQTFQNKKFDMIADEVDEILDQNRPMAIVNPISEMVNCPWIFDDINQFVDRFYSSSQQFTADEWLLLAHQYLLEKYKHDIEKTKQIRQINYQGLSWKNLISGSILSKHYIKYENQFYILQKIQTPDTLLYKITPYLDKKPFFGFHFGLDGLTQCLAKRLEHTKKIKFYIPPLSQTCAYLNPFDYKNITHFTGLSGSNGKVIELNELTKIFEAQSIRIGRYKPKKLGFLGTILAVNHKEQLKQLKNFVTQKDQPILIFCENIAASYEIYTHLSLLSHKTCFLITGQESQAERENWLYNKNATHHAGRQNCITIGTSILGRGIDIIPLHKKGLLAIKTHLEDNERVETQQNGRPARAGAKGEIVSILNIEEVLEKTKRLKLTNVSTHTLTSYKAQVQKFKIKTLINQRAKEQLRLWCWTQLQEHLHQTLEDPLNIPVYEHYLLKIFISEWKSFSNEFDIKNEEHIDWVIRIWNKTKLILANHEIACKPSISDDFKTQLKLATHWRQVTNPDLKTHAFFTHAPISKTPANLSSISSQIFFEIDYKQLIKLTPPRPPQWQLSWLNPPAYLIGNYLHQAWEIFIKEPNLNNFQIFYETLLSARKLHQMQKKQSYLRPDYWFDSLNLLFYWSQFEENLSNIIKLSSSQDKVLSHSKSFKKFLDKKSSTWIESPYLQDIITFFLFPIRWLGRIFNKMMLKLFPDALKTYKAVQKAIRNLEKEKTLSNIQKLHENLNQFLIFYDKIKNLPIWRLDKYYWMYFFSDIKNQIHIYSQDLSAEQDILLTFKDWLNDRKLLAHFRLKCLGHFLCQEHIMAEENYLFPWSSSFDHILSSLNEEYHETHHDFTSQKIYEIGRFFKKELQIKYISSIQTKNETTHTKPYDMTQHSMYYELAKFVISKHIKEGFETCEHHSTIRLKTLEQELVNAENNREFLSIL